MGNSNRKLNVVLTAQDEASSKLKKATASINAGLKKVGIAAAAMGAALALGVKKSVDAFIVQERAEKRLEQLTRQTTNATDDQIAALKGQARALQKVGVIGDEVLIFGQSQLATFALQTDSIAKLTPAMADLAVSVKGVNATQEDMINIGNLVGKVMGGQVGALSRLGITFDIAQSRILVTGTEMEKAATLAEVLAQNVGGLNKAMADTAEGGLAKASNAFGDMKEELGRAFAPMIIEVSKKVQVLAERFGKWASENPELVFTITKITGAVLAFLVVVPLIIGAITSIGTAFIFLSANPIVLIIAAIAALILGVIYLVKNFDTLKKNVILVLTEVQKLFQEIFASIIQTLTSWGETINNLMSEFLGGIKDAWENTWNAISDFTSSVLNGIGNMIDGVIGKILGAINKIKELASKAKSGLSAAGGAIKSGVSRAFGRNENGGNVFAGQTRIVGERGPEVVNFSRGGRVVPNNQLSGGGGTVINISLSGNTLLSDAREVAQEIGNMIIGDLRLQQRLT